MFRKTTCLVLSFAMSAVFAQSSSMVDESEMFGDTVSVIKDTASMNNAVVQNSAETKSVSISGELTAGLTGFATRDYFDKFDGQYAHGQTGTYGNLFLDIRQLQGLKAFANLEVQYDAATAGTAIYLRELFLDANINNRAYFRIGKQVLQWGRCYFWNPTDLINVEKKSFVKKLGYREGTFGIKAHVPFGTTANIYGFLDTRNVDSLGGAIKFEYLIGNTEMALALWNKKGYLPVVGYDISSRVFGVDIAAEASLSYGDNRQHLRIEDPSGFGPDTFKVLSIFRDTTTWTPRVCVNLSKSFEVLDVKDRLMVIGEFYYNYSGMDDNAFDDRAIYRYKEPLKYVSGSDTISIPGGYKKMYVLSSLYDANSYSKYYFASYTSLSKFIISDLTLSLNVIGNLNQRCATVATGVSYQAFNNFNLGLNLIGYVGETNSEYTANFADMANFTNNAMAVQLTAGLSF